MKVRNRKIVNISSKLYNPGTGPMNILFWMNKWRHQLISFRAGIPMYRALFPKSAIFYTCIYHHILELVSVPSKVGYVICTII